MAGLVSAGAVVVLAAPVLGAGWPAEAPQVTSGQVTSAKLDLAAGSLAGVGGATEAGVGWSSSVDGDEESLPDGLELPRTGMVHAIDMTRVGPVLVQLHATEIATNSHAAGNFLRRQVYVGPRSSVELKGLNAEVHLENAGASFLVRLTGDDPELLRTRVHLIRLEQREKTRVVSTYAQNILGGGRTRRYDEVAITKSDLMPEVWLRVTPLAPLAPGEYGIVLIPKDVDLIPEAVYDFDVEIGAAKAEK